MSNVLLRQISPAVMPALLLVCCVSWAAGMCVASHFGERSIDGWSCTPLLWMLTIAITPAFCIVAGIALLIDHRRSPLKRYDRVALAIAIITFLLSSVVVFGVASSMHGMGLL